MPDRKRRLKILMLHMILLPTLIYTLFFFSLAPRSRTSVNEAVVAPVAKEQGKGVLTSLVNSDKGDLLLGIFLLAGAIGGFAGGYYWRMLISEKKNPGERS